MKSITKFINEAEEKTLWCAISVTKEDDYSGKYRTSERVVSWETYQDLKNGRKKRSKAQGRNRWGEEYDEVDTGYVELLGKSYDKETAMSYLSKTEKTQRKTSIKAGDADYIVYCISSGKFNAKGNTSWNWSIFDEEYGKDCEIYFGSSAILFGAKGSLKEGDKLCCVDNDSLKKLPGAPNKVELVTPCTYDGFVDAYRKAFPSWCKRPTRQFGKVLDGLPWQRMGQMYSIKGIEDVKKVEQGKDTTVGSVEDKGKATENTKKEIKQDEPKKIRSNESPTGRWLITYEQETPMGLSSSHIYTQEVYAKTKKGAEGVYKREIYHGPSSAYATYLIKIEPILR